MTDAGKASTSAAPSGLDAAADAGPPQAITLTSEGLRLRWPDLAALVPADALRAACRCAGCRVAARTSQPPPAAPARLVDAIPVGRYALQLVFGDGHDRGIYPWQLLRELAAAPACLESSNGTARISTAA